MTATDITDLKRFIKLTLSQQLAELQVELRANWRQDIDEACSALRDELRADIKKLDTKIDNLAGFTFETIENYHDDHERRIVKLERQAT